MDEGRNGKVLLEELDEGIKRRLRFFKKTESNYKGEKGKNLFKRMWAQMKSRQILFKSEETKNTVYR